MRFGFSRNTTKQMNGIAKVLSLACAAWLLVAGAHAADAPKSKAAANQAGIHPWLDEGERVTADVLLDGKRVASLDDKPATAGLKRKPAVSFPIPPGSQKIELQGSLVSPEGKTREFRHTWSIVDLGRTTAPLYDARLSLAQRMQAFAKQTDALSVSSSSPKAGSRRASLKALEGRLKVKLPKEVYTLSEYAISIGDSYFVSADHIKTLREVLISEWFFKDYDELSPATRARYDRSIALFVEVGDGYGALAWDPAGVVEGEPASRWGDKTTARKGSDGDGVWYWIHQDSIDSQVLLLDQDYRPMAAEQALMTPVYRFGMGEVEDEAIPEDADEDGYLLVDSSRPNSLLQLHFDRKGWKLKPKLWFRSYDYHYGAF